MDVGGLAIVILQDVGDAAMQHARLARTKRRGMLAQRRSAPAGFNADQFHSLVIHERRKNSRGVAPAANAGDHIIRQTSLNLQTLLARLPADDGLKIAARSSGNGCGPATVPMM